MDSLSHMVEILRLAMSKWCEKSTAYNKVYKGLSPGAHAIITCALSELRVIKPGMWNLWWAKEHMRFIGTCQQREISLLNELMHYFLTDLARGKIETTEETTAQETESSRNGGDVSNAAKNTKRRSQVGQELRA